MSAIQERPRTNGATQRTPTGRPPRRPSSDMSGYWAALALILGLLVPVLGGIAIWMGVSAHNARQDANKAVQAVGSGSAMPGMDISGSGDLQSFAGQGPANAAALAAKHVPMNAALPPAPAGPIARVHLVLVDKTIEIAPGIKYSAWAFSGGAPAPFIHVRQGQRVELTLTNKGVIPHSVDFMQRGSHRTSRSATCSPALRSTTASSRTIPAPSCSTGNEAGARAHCERHVRRDHRRAPRAAAARRQELRARRQRVVSQLRRFPQAGNPGHGEGAATGAGLGDLERLRGQYVSHPLTADPGQTVRFWVVDAGPSYDTEFHIVGTILTAHGSTVT